MEFAGVEMRRAIASDAKFISQAVHFAPDSNPADVDAYAAWLVSAIERDLFLGWVATVNGQIIATAAMILFELGPIRGTTNAVRGRLSAVFTDPKHRSRGLATQLCSLALASARERGVEVFSLAATDAGRTIYERLGFKSYPAEMRLVLPAA